MIRFNFRDTVHSARYSIGFCGVLFIGYVFMILSVNLGLALRLSDALVLHSSNAFSWTGFYSLFTYWIIHPGLLFWAGVSISFILSGLILERVYSPGRLAVLIAGGVILGGSIFAALDNSDEILVGSAMGAWSYGGAALVVVFRTWKSTTLFSKLYCIYLCVSFVLAIEVTPTAFAQIAAGAFGVAFGWFFKPVLHTVESTPGSSEVLGAP